MWHVRGARGDSFIVSEGQAGHSAQSVHFSIVLKEGNICIRLCDNRKGGHLITSMVKKELLYVFPQICYRSITVGYSLIHL